MKLRNLVISSTIAGGLLLCAGGVVGYQYVSNLNKQLDTVVLPHTTFEGISLDGKSKKEVQEIIHQKGNELQKNRLTTLSKAIHKLIHGKT